MTTPTLNALIAERLSRRDFLLKGAGASLGAAMPIAAFSPSAAALAASGAAPLAFEDLAHSYTKTHEVAKGYAVEIVLKWGDTIIGPERTPFTGPTTPEDQARQFGTNCDYIAFMALPIGSARSDHGLLCVNHEYARPRLMFAAYTSDAEAAQLMSHQEAEIEMCSIGHAVVEINRETGRWRPVADSTYNRRVTALTPIEITGPAAGHPRLQTKADPTGRRVLGTLDNCAGGFTPWGTVLSAEENFQNYFWGDLREYLGHGQGLGPHRIAEATERRNHQSLGVGYFSELDANGTRLPPARGPSHGWYRFDPRFDIVKEPFEPNRFGYIVEIDPYDPSSTPKKRTALGRFRHENASVHAQDGKPVIVYLSDDAIDQFIYRFVSMGKYRAGDRAANMNLLEDGELFAARFNADGTGDWLRLEHGKAPITEAETGLKERAEIFIETRLVASRLGATPMDRPEDIEVIASTGRVYVALTSEPQRTPERTNPANPRAQNMAGHIIEMLPPGADGARDHWSDRFGWEIFLLAGDPKSRSPSRRGAYHKRLSASGWFANPDNLTSDPKGRLWIATDGFNDWVADDAAPGGVHDGLWASELVGPNRALTKHFFGCPAGAEATGPCFTPDGRTLFLSIQHPGDESTASNLAAPGTRWPDFDPKLPPRASVIAITKLDGGEIGS
jgi:hypothetical protein